MKKLGRTETIAFVISLTVVLGLVIGFAGRFTALPPAILWAVLFPVFYGYWSSLLKGRTQTGEPAHAGTETVLLEASDTGRRWIQTLMPLVGTGIGAAGVSMWFRADGGPTVLAVAATVIGIGVIVWSLRTIITWDLSYKGHAIRFQNDPCLTERLFIDGQLVARGGVGLHMVLSGAIASGDGAGTTIIATSRAGLFSFSCRIIAVSTAGARV